VYNEVSNNFTPTDSNYTKQRLIGLHPNIFVQRSPSHFQTGTFYWAHHEKLCVIECVLERACKSSSTDVRLTTARPSPLWAASTSASAGASHGSLQATFC
jgi:hypothetical protein